MQGTYCWKAWILPLSLFPLIPFYPEFPFPSFLPLSRCLFLCISLFLSPPPPQFLWIYTGVDQGQDYSSVLFSSAISQCSALGVLPMGFFLYRESCNKSKYRSAKNDVKLGKHFINCYSLASRWLGDLVSGLRSFPIKVSGRIWFKVVITTRCFLAYRKSMSLGLSSCCRDSTIAKKPLITSMEGLVFSSFFFFFVPDRKMYGWMQTGLFSPKQAVENKREDKLHILMVWYVYSASAMGSGP